MTGFFQGSATFGPGETNKTTLTSCGSFDIFVAKFGSLLDDFLCYKAKTTKGPPKFGRRKVSLDDQIEDGDLPLKNPAGLCNPVDKNGEGFKSADDHLMCYQIKSASGELKHVRRTGIHVNNQFGPEQLDTIKEEDLCVPSKKTLTPP